MSDQTTPETEKPSPPRRRNGWRRAIAVVLVSLVGPGAVIGGGLALYLKGGRYAKTDNAYIKSEKIAVSSDVSGRVIEVLVADNQTLEQGWLMFRIDREPFEIALKQAEAALAAVRHEILALRALYRQKQAELRRAKGDIEFYQRQFDRQKALTTKGFSAEQNLDAAEKELRNARDRVSAIRQDIARTLADLGGTATGAIDDHPRVLKARAERDRAALELAWTEVTAPVPGVVTNFDLQVGEYIEAGDAVFSLVGIGQVWVQANFKETDLTRVRVGQRAAVRIDTYPDLEKTATVASISPATGAEFALLPPQNTSGNWVKAVQRLPVRLELDSSEEDPPLRAGMSVVVEIDTEHQRKLADLGQAALTWLRDFM